MKFALAGAAGAIAVFIAVAGAGALADTTTPQVAVTLARLLTIKVLNRFDTLDSRGAVPPTTFPINGQNYATNSSGMITVRLAEGTVSFGLGTTSGADSTFMAADRWRFIGQAVRVNDQRNVFDTLVVLARRRAANGVRFDTASVIIRSNLTIEIQRLDANYFRPATFVPAHFFAAWDLGNAANGAPSDNRGAATFLTRTPSFVQISGSFPDRLIATMDANTATLFGNASDSLAAGTAGVYRWRPIQRVTVLDTNAVGTAYMGTSSDNSDGSACAVDSFRATTACVSRRAVPASLAAIGTASRAAQQGASLHELSIMLYQVQVPCTSFPSVTLGARSNCPTGSPSFEPAGLSAQDRAHLLATSMGIEFNIRSRQLAPFGITHAVRTGEYVAFSVNPDNKDK